MLAPLYLGEPLIPPRAPPARGSNAHVRSRESAVSPPRRGGRFSKIV
jgi:hypothetical protein